MDNNLSNFFDNMMKDWPPLPDHTGKITALKTQQRNQGAVEDEYRLAPEKTGQPLTLRQTLRLALETHAQLPPKVKSRTTGYYHGYFIANGNWVKVFGCQKGDSGPYHQRVDTKVIRKATEIEMATQNFLQTLPLEPRLYHLGQYGGSACYI